jgi:hypothetical protein
MSDQNPICRRAYVVRPRQDLLDRLREIGEEDLLGLCGEPSVVMTEPLPYEGKLEGYRALILAKCKEAYISDLFEFEPFSDSAQRVKLLGDHETAVATFDQWWTAEKADTLEIKTTW